jgi:sigma-B regulation protein RsbU (phosphoserine phosphatase)
MSGGAWFNRALQQELVRTDDARRTLQLALAEQVAERLDGDLRQLAGVARTLAGMLARRTDWTEPQLDACLREMLDADPRIFGMCVAFEPYRFQPDREDYARYICRTADGVELKYLHPPAYRPYRAGDWYRTPQREGQPSWTEPYIDTGGGDVPMVTYSVPFVRDGEFTGIVTVDLSLEYFRHLKQWLDELGVARGDYGFVISRAGTFISHQNAEYQMHRQLSEFATTDFDPGFRSLLELIRRRKAGRVQGTDFWTGEPRVFLAAPVPSSGWTFVAVVPAGSTPGDRSTASR